MKLQSFVVQAFYAFLKHQNTSNIKKVTPHYPMSSGETSIELTPILQHNNVQPQPNTLSLNTANCNSRAARYLKQTH